MTEMVHKVTLSSGKIVYLKDMDTGKEELAFQAASSRTDKETMIAYYAIGELVKVLLTGYQLSADSEIIRPNATQIEMIDKILTYSENKQVREVISKMMGEGLTTKPTIEIVNFGSTSLGANATHP